jgi:hypothetical protein
MSNAILDGLSLLDPVGLGILATNAGCLVCAVGAHLALRARYDELQRDLEHNGAARRPFTHPVFNRIVREAADTSGESNAQAVVEDNFRSGFPRLLLAERFVRAATSLVLVLGLLGTFYGLTLSIGKLVHLVSADAGAVTEVTQAVTHGLTEALTGMAVAFSNSLVGIAAAVLLTVLGVVNNVADRRTALMIQMETYLDRERETRRPPRGDIPGSLAGFGDSVARLEAAVARFDASLRSFAASTKDLREVHLVVGLKPGDRS